MAKQALWGEERIIATVKPQKQLGYRKMQLITLAQCHVVFYELLIAHSFSSI